MKNKPYIIFFLIALFGLGIADYNYKLGGMSVPAEAFNPAMTQEVLCADGFTTKSVRPAVYITNKIKKEMLVSGKVSDFQLDHIVSLCLGGSPLNPANLQMQPLEIAHKKDIVEKQLCRDICSGKITLEKDQKILYFEWEKYYEKNYGGLTNLGSIVVEDLDDN